jgi:hypothetical protein
LVEEDERPPPGRRRPSRVYAPVFQRLGLTPEEDEPAAPAPARPPTGRGPALRHGDRPNGRGPSDSTGPRRFRTAAPRAGGARPTGPAGTAGSSPSSSAGPQPAIQLDDFTQAVVNRVIKTRQRDWQPTLVRRSAQAVDATIARELALGEDGAIGGDFESVADHLDFLRAAGDAWTGRAVAVAARRIGLSERAARLAGRLAARLPVLRYETQLWACALLLRVVDACVRAELVVRRPEALSRGDVTEADIARHLADARRQVLGHAARPRRRRG